MLGRSIRVALLTLAALAPASAAQAASLWTPLTSGTTHTISAIAWPSANEIVLVTTVGDILHSTSGTFAASTVTPANPSGFTDVAMSADGKNGVAVGPSGMIYNSVDSGLTWNKVTMTQEYPGGCGASGMPGPLTDDLYSVQFASASTVYVTGANRDVLKSTDGGVKFVEVNKSTQATCKVTTNDDLTDTAWIDANTGFLMSKWFGGYYATTDGLGSAVGSKKGEALNSAGAAVSFALDRSDPKRAWAASSFPSGGSLTLEATTDGGATWAKPKYDEHNHPLRDIATAGGTVVTVGDTGDIYTSADGKNFARQAAAAPNDATDWHAVAMLDASHAVVGGAGGVLLYSAKANQLPDTIPPTGTITGPRTLALGQFGSYVSHVTDNVGGSGVDPSGYVWSTAGQPNQTTVNASFAFNTLGSHLITLSFRDLAGNPGTATITVNVEKPPPTGSSPVSGSSGGGTVTIFKRVTVTGHKRYIPVQISSKKKRKFVITVLTVKKHHHVAVAYATLSHGTKVVQVPLANSVKTGKYLLVVRIFDSRGHGLGRQINLAFILA